MGQCQYRYNPTELYQRTKPGMAPETICGAQTFPAVDEPEIQAYTEFAGGPLVYKPTGRMLARGYHDPYCPAHGGTPEPPPPPVTIPELESAYNQYLSLAERFTGAVPAEIPNPASLKDAITGLFHRTPQELENNGQ